MIKVCAINYLKKECVDDFLATAKELVAKTNELDEGCIKYELCRDINDPQRFVMSEEWTDKNALDKHMSAKHFVDLVPKLREYSAKPSDLMILELMF